MSEPLEVRLLLSAVTGQVFHDADANGIQGETERLVEGLPVHLWDAGVDANAGTADDVLVESTLTGSAGTYEFNVESTATYFVQFGSQTGLFGLTEQVLAPSGRIASDADAGTTYSTTFAGGVSGDDIELNAGIVFPDDAEATRNVAKAAYSYQPTRDDYHFNVYGENEKWLYGERGSLSRVYFITPDGDLYNWDSTPFVTSGEFLGNVGPDAHVDPSTLIGEGTVDVATETDAETAYRLDNDHDLRARDTWYEEYASLGVRWLLGNVNSHGNQWYFITPEGEFWEWDRVLEQASGTKLADLSSDYFNDPVLLTNAQRPGEELGATSRVKDAFGITSAVAAPASVVAGDGVVWLKGAINEFSNRNYFLSNNGDFHAWDGTTNATGRQLTTLDVSVFTSPDLLVDALAPIDNSSPQQMAFDLSRIYQLDSPGWYFRDFGGQGEAWVRGSRNLHNNDWYFVQPNGDFAAWDGTPRSATGTKLATLSPLYNAQPHLLHIALPPIGNTTTLLNRPPVIDAVENLTATVGVEIEIDMTARDLDADTLTISLVTENGQSPTNATIEATGNGAATIRWTPTEAEAGMNIPFRITVTDDGNPVEQDIEDFFVSVSELPNTAPVIAAIADQAATIGTDFSLDVTATDADSGDLLTFSLDTTGDASPITATIEQTGNTTATIRWTAEESEAGMDIPFRVVVSDNGSPVEQDIENFVVTVAELPNNAPVIGEITDQVATVGTEFSLDVTAADADIDDVLTFSLDTTGDASPITATIEQTSNTTATIRWMPLESDSANSIPFRLIVTDDHDPVGQDTEEFSVNVSAANNFPEITGIDDQSAIVGSQLVVSVSATDADVEDVLVFSVEQNGNVVSDDVVVQSTGNGTALIRWTPTVQHVGTSVPFRVTVSDGRGGQDTEEYSVDVTATDDANIISESTDFSTSVSQTVELGQSSGSRHISFDLQDAFDRSDTTSVAEDIFQVHLRDPATGETLLEGRASGTAVFSLAGDVAEFQQGVVLYDGSRVEIDVTSLGDLTSADLVFQFINSDSDDGSKVAIGEVTSTVDGVGKASPTLNRPTSLVAPAGPVDLAGMTETSDVRLSLSNVQFDETTGNYSAELIAHNDGPAIGRQLVVLFPSLPDDVMFSNASGTDSNGVPYVNLSTAIGSGGLATNASTQSVTIQLSNPNFSRFRLIPKVLSAGANVAPTLGNIAEISAVPGDYVEVKLDAHDSDGDRLTYSLASAEGLPNGSLSAGGTLKFRPLQSNIGQFSFTVTVTDGMDTVSRSSSITVSTDTVTSTRFEGVVLDTNEVPIPNLPVEIRNIDGVVLANATTAADGQFHLEGDAAIDADTIIIRGDLFSGTETYPFIAEKFPLVLGHDFFPAAKNVLPRPIYLPALDVAGGTVIDPAQDTTVEQEIAVGEMASVFVKAGSLKMDDGSGNMVDFTGTLSITEVPRSLTPADLPPNLLPAIVVTIQPGEMLFAEPAKLTLPNRGNESPGTKMDLWSLNPETGDFEIVGEGQVTADGRSIETISGGIRNSSWHGLVRKSPKFQEILNRYVLALRERHEILRRLSNPTLIAPDSVVVTEEGNCGCPSSEGKVSRPLSSDVDLQTGALRESHALVPYQSLGQTRGVRLTYNSLHADPQPIIGFGFGGVGPLDPNYLIAEAELMRGEFSYQLPGFEGGNGLDGGEHFWMLPSNGETITAALQADMSSFPTGTYDYTLRAGLFSRAANGDFSGSSLDTTGKIHVTNLIASPFGAGWSLAGQQEIVENPDGSVLLLDGAGTRLIFEIDPDRAGGFLNPPADFSTFEQLTDGTYRRTLPDQTVYQFNEVNQLITITDRNGRSTRWEYSSAGELMKWIDPVGLETRFEYTNGKVTSIIDPADRTTRLDYDSAGNLSSITDPDSTSRDFGYDVRHRLTSETDQRGATEQTFYGLDGRAIGAVLKDGTSRTVRSLQSAALLPFSETSNPDTAPQAPVVSRAVAQYAGQSGSVDDVTVDAFGQAVENQDPEGRRSAIRRNENNQVTRSIDARGNTTHFSYDDRGNITGIRDSQVGHYDVLVTGAEDGGIYTLSPTLGVASPFYPIDPSSSSEQFFVDVANLRAGVVDPVALTSTGAIYSIDVIEFGPQLIMENLDFAESLAVDRDGQLFAAGSELHRIDLNARTTTLIADLSNFSAVRDISFDADNNLFMVAVEDNFPNLYRVDIDAGDVSLVNELSLLQTDGFGPNIVGLAYGGGGALFGVSDVADSFEIITETAELIPVTNREFGEGLFVGRAGDFDFGRFMPTQNYAYDESFGQLTSSSNGNENQVFYEVDPANGNRLSILEVVGEVDDAANGETDDLLTLYTYTSLGLVDTITDPLRRLTDFDYDILGRLETVTFAVGTADEASRSFEYDAAGNQTATIDENENRTTYVYDSMNRLTQITEPDPDGPDEALTSPITLFTYDERGNLLTTTDARENVTTNVYDELDRVIRSIDADERATRFEYDEAGNIAEVIDPLGFMTENKYDGRNRLVETIDPDGGTTKFAYDLDDNLTSLIDPVGNETRFEYDARDRLVVEIDPLGEKKSYVYDPADNLVWKRDRNGRITTFEYDDRDRLVTETWLAADGTTVENTIDYLYDKAGNLLNVDDEFSELTFVYDHRDRVETVNNAGTPDVPNVVLTYEYDGVGNVTSVTDTVDGVAGASTGYAYDALNRTMTVQQSGTNVSDKLVDFVYNELGQFDEIVRYADLNRTALVAASDYEYDELNRLTDLDHTNSANEVLAFYDFEYDPSSRITQITDIDGVTDYSYDDRSQLTGADRDASDVRGDESYEYDANGNRINSHRHGDGYVTGPANRLESDGTYNYQYDAEGNMTRRTEISTNDYREFVWDHRNRLVSVTDRGSNGTVSQVVEFNYDALDRRITKLIDADGDGAEAASTLHFVYDREDVIIDFADADGPVGASPPLLDQRYLHGPGTDQVLAQESLEAEWFLSDHLGTPRDIVASTGVLLNHITFGGYGNLIGQTNSTVSTRYGFTGREFDAKTGLTYYRARYYDGRLGRFTSEDPILASEGNANLYTYVVNIPNQLIDPSGREAVTIGAGGRVAFFLGIGVNAGLTFPDTIDDVYRNERNSGSNIVSSAISAAGEVQGTFGVEGLIGAELSAGIQAGISSQEGARPGVAVIGSGSINGTGITIGVDLNEDGTLGGPSGGLALPRLGGGLGATAGVGLQVTGFTLNDALGNRVNRSNNDNSCPIVFR